MVKTDKLFSSKACRRILYLIVLTLVFEGLLRKLSPGFLKIGLFFLKDFLCLAGVYVVLNTHISKLNKKIFLLWRNITLAFLPLIIYAFFLSPPLSVFGAKEYLLYFVIALMLPLAFPKDNLESLKRFLFFIALLVIPTTIVAIIQSNLPATHWLNMGVSGQSLAGFASKGKLRVSSTFSFTGQYAFFLNIASSVFAASFFIPPSYTGTAWKRIRIPLLLTMVVLLIIGNFITGGRTAVLGSGAALLAGFIFTANRYPGWFVTKGVLIIFSGLFMLTAVKIVKPEFFEVYERRSHGTETQSHSEEVEGRLTFTFLGWTEWFSKREFGTQVIGEGIGVMSNGSDQISSYAANIRNTGLWMETDIATTFWEGGIYLAVIWYTLRLYVIYYCFRLCQSMKRQNFGTATMFLLGFITVNALLGTLGIQPPLAIWFWLAVGAIIVISQSDKHIANLSRNQQLETNKQAGMVAI